VYDDVTAGERGTQGLFVKRIGNPAIQIEAREPGHAGDGSHDRPHFRQTSQV
jgi:hypothetical protein